MNFSMIILNQVSKQCKTLLCGDWQLNYIKTEDFYEDNVEKRFGTSNYEVDRPLPIGKK